MQIAGFPQLVRIQYIVVKHQFFYDELQHITI